MRDLWYNIRIMELNRKLIKLRKENSLSQAQLANKLGVGQATICQWEKGVSMPSCECLCKLAIELEVSTDYLLGLTDNDAKHFATYRNTTNAQNQLLNLYKQLSGSQKECVYNLIKEFVRNGRSD